MSGFSTPGARLLARRRHDEILRRLAIDGSVGVGELAAFFGISRETIRRDFRQLADRGHVEIVHGGAARREPFEPPFGARAEHNAEGKAAIGRTAAALVEDGMTVLFDSGTTTLAIARALVGRQNLTVCTGSLAIAQLMCRVSGTAVYMLGGRIDPTEEAATGVDVLETIGRFRFDLAFVGGGAVSADGEVTDYTRIGAEQRGRMLRSASRAYFVVDSTKFGQRSPVRIPHFESAAGLITDRAPGEPIAEALTQIGVPLLMASIG